MVENMSFFVCPNCNARHDIFGSGGAQRRAAELGVPFLGRGADPDGPASPGRPRARSCGIRRAHRRSLPGIDLPQFRRQSGGSRHRRRPALPTLPVLG